MFWIFFEFKKSDPSFGVFPINFPHFYPTWYGWALIHLVTPTHNPEMGAKNLNGVSRCPKDQRFFHSKLPICYMSWHITVICHDIPPVTTITHTSPTKIHYNIIFYKISRRKEGGGGKEKIKKPQKYFSKKLFWIFFWFQKVWPKFCKCSQ